MTEELGVLYSEKWHKYYLYKTCRCISYVDNPHQATKCTRKQAEQFPQFKWVPLTKL